MTITDISSIMIKVVINNRNRLTSTKNMVEHLLRLNPNEQIIILDNGSTYPPLLEWYKTIKCQINYIENHGHLAFWSIGLDKTIGDYFVYTDSDIELNNYFPTNWKEIMLEKLQKHNVNKVALALDLKGIPNFYRYKNQVLRNEERWWVNEIEDNVFEADTDTTFFLMKNIFDNCYKSIRLAHNNMICKHLPWYDDLSNLSEEEKYYLEHLGDRQLTQYSKQHKHPQNYTDV